MELANHKCIGFCEFDKFAVASYTSMHIITPEQREGLTSLTENNRKKEIIKEMYKNGEWYANDVRGVDARSMPRADCWCFGFPCQDISIAGKQIGFDGKRSSLFFAITRIVRDTKEEDRPKFLFIENVKNLLSVNRGADFLKLFVELDEIGYDAEWQVLNSKDFGVPQNRERAFIVGHLRGRGGRKVFPITETTGENHISLIGHRDGYRRNLQTYEKNGITEALDTCQGGGLNITENARCLQARYNKGISNRSGEVSSVAIPVLAPDRGEKRQKGRRFKENGDPMFTLTSQDRHGVVININQNLRIRKLTPKECFRLQGWPDKYFERAKMVNSDSQLYKQAGNGVTVNVIYAIAKNLE